MARFIKRGLFCISLTFFSTTAAFSQWYPNNEYRRVSVAVNGGAALGDSNRNFHFMASNFTGNVEDTPIFGFGIQYALSPAWSLELGYQRIQIKGASRPFETNMDLLSLKNILNLNQLIFINRLSNRINPYLTAGVGYDFFSYDGPEAKFKDYNTSLNAGAGLAYKLTNTVDLFAHYEYHLGSNTIDNEKDGWGADLINTVTGGVRVNFGKREAKHLSWRTVPLNLKESDYNRYLAQANKVQEQANQIEKQAHQIEELKRQLELMAQREKELKRTYAANIGSSEQPIDDENQTNSTRQAFAEQKCIEVAKEPPITDSMATGHYVQIFANRNLMVSNYIRGHAVERLKDILENTGYEVSLYHRNGFYEVMVGKFENIDQAEEIREIMNQVYEDAFVISFPRAPAPIKIEELARGAPN